MLLLSKTFAKSEFLRAYVMTLNWKTAKRENRELGNGKLENGNSGKLGNGQTGKLGNREMGNGKWENNRLTELKSNCNQNTMTFFQTNARGYGEWEFEKRSKRK